MNRDSIRIFVDKYLIDDGTPVECITEYRKYDIKKIEKDKKDIVRFFNSIYNFDDYINLSYLVEDKSGNNIYVFNNLLDLDEFEDMVGLLIASGILVDDYFDRIDAICDLGPNTKYLERELHSLDTYELVNAYVNKIKKYVLPNYHFKVNISLLNQLIDNDNNNQYDLKEVMRFWFHKTNFPINDIINEIIENLLNSRLEKVIKYAVLMTYMKTDAQATLIMNALAGVSENIFAHIEHLFSRLGDEDVKEYENEKKEFIDQLVIEMNKKNRSL